MQGWFNVQKSVNIIHPINSQNKKQYHITISGDATKKHSDKFLQPFLIKDGSPFQSLPSTCPSPPRHGSSHPPPGRIHATWLECICKPGFVYLTLSLKNLTRGSNKRHLPTVRLILAASASLDPGYHHLAGRR